MGDKEFKEFIFTVVVGIPILIALMCMFSGCASNCNQVMGKNSVWASGSHAYFSVQGYKNVSVKDVNKSNAEGWWGCEVEVKKAR